MVKKGIIKQNILSREILIEIILTAVFISLGSNMIITSLSNLKNSVSIIFLIIGIALVILSSGILIYKNFRKFNQTVLIKGFIIYDKKENKIIDVDNYHLSYDLVSKLNSAFNEEKSFKTIWDKVPLKEVFKDPIPKKDKYKTSAKEIIEELFEYIFLENLSVTLTDFFNEKEFKEKDLIKYERKDIPGVLLTNRFLNLFSKPMEQREAFVKDFLTDDKHEGRVVSCDGKGGALYQEFDLTFPKKTKIKRLGPNKICLESDKMILKFDIIFDGCGVVLPTDFDKYYLGLNKDFMRYHHYRIDLMVDVKFKIRSLLFYKGWKYYEWLDKYLDTLNQEMSKNYFFKSINWEQIRALLYIMDKDKKIIKRKK